MGSIDSSALIRYLAPFLMGLGLASAALAAPAITVNGVKDAVVAPGSQMTVAVSGGPGKVDDWVSVRPKEPDKPDKPAPWIWSYLRGASMVMIAAPMTPTSNEAGGIKVYTMEYYTGTRTLLASVNFTVSGATTPPPTPTPTPTPMPTPSAGVSSIKCVGTVACPGSTGNVVVTGSSVAGPKGDKGDDGRTTGIISRNKPVAGSACVDTNGVSENYYSYVMISGQKHRQEYTCDADHKWNVTRPIPVDPY